MNTESGPMLRVERALRLLPDVDALAPLRAFLISTSRIRGSAEPYRTVGKRVVRADDLRDIVPRALERVTGHLSALYQSAVEALECEERGDLSGVVRALLRAGELEESVGRFGEAHTWYDHALRLAEELHDRQPETETLHRMGRLEAARGWYESAARHHQRSLALSDAEGDHSGAARACLGLGEIALAQEKGRGAASWYTRGLKYAAEEADLLGQMYVGLGAVARSQGELERATEWLLKAKEVFEGQGNTAGMVQMLNGWGAVEALRGHQGEALASYRDALARMHPALRDPGLEMTIRLNLCQLYVDWDRLPDAEDEIRRAEEMAIVHNLARHLARLYVLLGGVRALQGDETGFVFFEKAIELCRGPEPFPRLEADAYVAYSKFRRQLGDTEESRAYLERAREILETVGNGSTLARIDAELAQMPPV